MGPVTGPTLPPAIRDVLVDLHYRGNYTGTTREVVQPPAVENDVTAFTAVLSDESYWRQRIGVPRNRYRRSRDYPRGRHLIKLPPIFIKAFAAIMAERVPTLTNAEIAQ
jgi:hypothetical protein